MKALKKPDIADLVAKDLEMDQKIVLKIVNSYWNEVIESIRNVKHINIRIHEIGDMRIAKSKVAKYREKLSKKVKPEYTNSSYHQGLQDRLNQIDNILDLIKQEYEKREVVRNKRKDYDKTKTNLE